MTEWGLAQLDEERAAAPSLRTLAALEASVLGDLLPDVRPRERPARSAYMRSLSRPGRRIVTRIFAPRRAGGPGGRPRAQAARSSAKSGDSPDDDPHEPAGPGWRWARTRFEKTERCRGCGGILLWNHGQLFCPRGCPR